MPNQTPYDKEEIKKQVRRAVEVYMTPVKVDTEKGKPCGIPEVQAALMSGFALTANFLARGDGGAVTPSLLLEAVMAVGDEMGLFVQQQKDSKKES